MAKVLRFPTFDNVQELRKQARENNRNAVGCNPVIIKTTDATYAEVDSDSNFDEGFAVRLYIDGVEWGIINDYICYETEEEYLMVVRNIQAEYNKFVEKL